MSCVAVLPHKGLPLIDEMLVYTTSTSSMDILNPAWAFEDSRVRDDQVLQSGWEGVLWHPWSFTTPTSQSMDNRRQIRDIASLSYKTQQQSRGRRSKIEALSSCHYIIYIRGLTIAGSIRLWDSCRTSGKMEDRYSKGSEGEANQKDRGWIYNAMDVCVCD